MSEKTEPQKVDTYAVKLTAKVQAGTPHEAINKVLEALERGGIGYAEGVMSYYEE